MIPAQYFRLAPQAFFHIRSQLNHPVKRLLSFADLMQIQTHQTQDIQVIERIRIFVNAAKRSTAAKKAARKAVETISRKYETLLVKYFPFSEDTALKEWEEKIFKGRVAYRIEKDGAQSYVRATSENAASAL